MSIVMIGSELHTAAVEPIKGSGLVLCPHPDDDLDFDNDSPSLAMVDAIRLIDRLGLDGWAVLEDDEGRGDDPYGVGCLIDSVRPDGRVLIMLWHGDPIDGQPDFSEMVESYVELRAALEAF